MSSAALIIEHTKDKLARIGEWVADQGYTAYTTQSGIQGIELARTRSPDLIVLDLVLSDLQGAAVCESLKLAEETNLIPVVMITREGEHDDLESGLRVGADAYVPIGTARDVLYRAIEEALDRRRSTVQAGHCGEVRFDFRSDVHCLKEVHRKITELFTRSALSEKEVREMGQAVLEMGMNAIEWGNRGNLELLVNMAYCFNQEKVQLTVRDQGPGFDPRNLPHAAKDEDPVAHMLVRETLGLREGGFGIMLAKGMVDSVRYNERGNEVTLVKFFNNEGSGGEDR
jgi:DNA-binding response OmpR family regulator